MKKLQSKNIHEYDLTPAKEQNSYYKVRARFETSKNEEDIKVPYDIFEKLGEAQEITKKQKLYLKYSFFPGRSGSVISIRDESYWTLDLITRVNKRNPRVRKYSISSVIDTLLDSLKSKSYSSENFSKTRTLPSSSSTIQDFMKTLTKIYITKVPDTWIESNDTNEEVLEVFIPELTYHPAPFFRSFYLAMVEPSLLTYNDFVLLVNTLNLPNEYGEYEPHDYYEFANTLRNININFFKLINDIDESMKKIENMTDDRKLKFNRDNRHPESRLMLKSNAILGSMNEDQIKASVDRLNLLISISDSSANIELI